MFKLIQGFTKYEISDTGIIRNVKTKMIVSKEKDGKTCRMIDDQGKRRSVKIADIKTVEEKESSVKKAFDELKKATGTESKTTLKKLIDRQSKKKGKISLFLGPMFASKTTSLVGKIHRYALAGKRVIYIDSTKNKRTEDSVVMTHDDIRRNAMKTEFLMDIYWRMKDLDCIGIDEGQFFSDLTEFCVKCANDGQIVIVSSLDGWHDLSVCPNIVNLIPNCENIKKLHAVCECGSPASFSWKYSERDVQFAIGGKETYTVVCRECRIKKISELNQLEQGTRKRSRPSILLSRKKNK